MSSPSERAATPQQPATSRPSHDSSDTPALLRAYALVFWQWLRTRQGQVSLAWAITLLAVALDILIVGRHAVLRYENYHADAFDLGNMNQAVWNTLHGHPFRFTNRGLDYNGPPTRLAVHVEPILLLIAPFYLISAGPATLIVIQAVVMALGAIPLLLLGLRHLARVPLLAAALAIAYLFTPEYLGAALWDFHSVALAAPLLLLALWALDAGRNVVFWVAAALAALCKEDVALSLALLGILLVLRGRRRLGLTLTGLSVAYVALCFFVILPHFGAGQTGGNNFWYRYAWLGGSPGAAIANIARDPLLPLSIMDAPRWGYVASLLRTTGGLALLSPVLLICALPEMAVNILSVHTEQYSGFFQYNAVILAYVMAAAVYGLATLYDARERAERGEKTVMAASLPDRLWARLAWAVAWLRALRTRLLEHIPLPSRLILPLTLLWLLALGWWNLSATGGGRIQGFWASGEHYNPNVAPINALLDRIPPDASVAATDSLDPRLSSRYTIYLLPDEQSYQAEYVAFDIPNAISISQQQDQMMLDRMLSSSSYTVVGRAGSVVLLHRTGPPLAPDTP